MKIISVRENPEYKEKAVRFFQQSWVTVPPIMYEDSISHSINAEDFGTNADGTRNEAYCLYCYQNGTFTRDVTMEEIVETNLGYLDHWNKETGNNFTPDEARPMLREFLSILKRWNKE